MNLSFFLFAWGFFGALIGATSVNEISNSDPSVKQWVFWGFLFGPVGWVVLILWGLLTGLLKFYQALK